MVSQQLSLLCGRWGFPHPLQLPSSARSSSSATSGSQCAAATIFSSGVASSSSSVSRNLCANCIAWLGAPPCITVFSKRKNSSLCNGRSLAIASCWICSATVNELVRTRAQLKAGRLESNLAPVPYLSEIPSEPGTPFAPVQCFERQKPFLRKRILGVCQNQDVECTSFVLPCTQSHTEFQILFEAVREIPRMIIPGFALRHARTVASCASSSVKSRVSSNKATPRKGRVVPTLLTSRFSCCNLDWGFRFGHISSIFLSMAICTRRGTDFVGWESSTTQLKNLQEC